MELPMLTRSTLLVLVALLFVSIEAQFNNINDNQDISSSVIHLTSNLYRSMREPKKNLIFSPISIQVALNLVLLGAEKGSPIEEELVRVLGYTDLTKSHLAFKNLVNELKNLKKKKQDSTYAPWFARYRKRSQNPRENSNTFLSIKSPGYYSNTNDSPDSVIDLWTMMLTKGEIESGRYYVRDIKSYYNSSIEDVSGNEKRAKVMNSVNKWGKEAGFENDLLSKSEMDDNFKVKLLSAIRLETKWRDSSLSESLTNSLFYNHGTEKVCKAKSLIGVKSRREKYVEFVESSRMKYKEHNNKLKSKHSARLKQLEPLNCRAISLDLKDGIEYVMIEPFSNKSGALEELEDKLFSTEKGERRQSMLSALLSVLDDTDTSIIFENLRMPQFKFDSDVQLDNHLKNIGLMRMFSDPLNRISPSLIVTEASHKAVVEVNQSGVKAVGLTGLSTNLSALIIEPGSIPVVLERPFVFIIRRKRIPLFAGRLDNL